MTSWRCSHRDQQASKPSGPPGKKAARPWTATAKLPAQTYRVGSSSYSSSSSSSSSSNNNDNNNNSSSSSRRRRSSHSSRSGTVPRHRTQEFRVFPLPRTSGSPVRTMAFASGVAETAGESVTIWDCTRSAIARSVGWSNMSVFLGFGLHALC